MKYENGPDRYGLRVATKEELAWLCQTPEGFKEWQIKKYNAETIDTVVTYLKSVDLMNLEFAAA